MPLRNYEVLAGHSSFDLKCRCAVKKLLVYSPYTRTFFNLYCIAMISEAISIDYIWLLIMGLILAL